MRNVIVTIATLFLAAYGAATPNPATAEPPPASVQKWICGKEYVNFAWGYRRRGMALDANGHVWSYDIKRTPGATPKPWNPGDRNSMTPAELEQRYAGATDTGQRVSAADIARNAPLIAEAANVKPTESKNVGADAGSYRLFCYRVVATTGRYSEVLLDQKGDWERTNPSPVAKTLAAWLDRTFSELK